MKRMKMALVVLALIAMIVTVSAISIWYYSTHVKVIVTQPMFSLTLTPAIATIEYGQSITFEGFLLKNSEPNIGPVAGATIHIYSTDIEGNIMVEVGTTTTLEDGSFTFPWTPLDIGDYYFKAGYEFIGP